MPGDAVMHYLADPDPEGIRAILCVRARMERGAAVVQHVGTMLATPERTGVTCQDCREWLYA